MHLLASVSFFMLHLRMAGGARLRQHSSIRKQVHIPNATISDDVEMPIISIGTGGNERGLSFMIVEAWLSIGGRGIDTSYSNWNQYDVGAAILRSGVPREELFITTKIPGCYAVDTYVQKNLEQLGLRYLDMVLLEFSMPYRLCAQSWHQLEKLVEEGVIRAIGVSNFRRVWLGALMEVATVKPAVHQIELSVFHPNWDTVEVSHAYNIKTQAYTPFGSESVQKRIVGNAVVQQIAQNHKVTPRQVALRWLLQRQHLLVITSVMVKHQLIDADVFSFNLLPEELDELDRLGDS